MSRQTSHPAAIRLPQNDVNGFDRALYNVNHHTAFTPTHTRHLSSPALFLPRQSSLPHATSHPTSPHSPTPTSATDESSPLLRAAPFPSRQRRSGGSINRIPPLASTQLQQVHIDASSVLQRSPDNKIEKSRRRQHTFQRNVRSLAIIIAAVIVAAVTIYFLFHLYQTHQPLHTSASSPRALLYDAVRQRSSRQALPAFDRLPTSQQQTSSLTVPSSLSHYDNNKLVTSVLLFTTMREFTKSFAASNRREYDRYSAALRSWQLLTTTSPAVTVSLLVFVDALSSCAHISGHIPAMTVYCRVTPCKHETYNKPTLDCMWRIAYHETNDGGYDVYSFINVVSRRRDTSLDKTTEMNSEDLYEYIMQKGILHDEFGIDIFIISQQVMKHIVQVFPPFLVGVYRWDNWLLAYLLLYSSYALHDDHANTHTSASSQSVFQVSYTVIDATLLMTVGHDDTVSQHLGDTGAAYNDALIKELIGHQYRIGNIAMADYILRPHLPTTRSLAIPHYHPTIITTISTNNNNNNNNNKLRVSSSSSLSSDEIITHRHNMLTILMSLYGFIPQHNRIELAMARHTSSSHSIGLLSINILSYELYLQFICYSKHIRFAEYISIIEDDETWWLLVLNGHRNIVMSDFDLLNPTHDDHINTLNNIIHNNTLESGDASNNDENTHGIDSDDDESHRTLIHQNAVYRTDIIRVVLDHSYNLLLLEPDIVLTDHPFFHLNHSCAVQATPISLTASSTSATSNAVTVLDSGMVWIAGNKYGRFLYKHASQCVHRVLTGNNRDTLIAASKTYAPCQYIEMRCVSEVIKRQMISIDGFHYCDRNNLVVSTSNALMITQNNIPLILHDGFISGKIQSVDDRFTQRKELQLLCPLIPSTLMITPLIDDVTPVMMKRSSPSSISTSLSDLLRHIIIHVHVRHDATERDIRLLIRSLQLAHYTKQTSIIIIDILFDLSNVKPSSSAASLYVRFESLLHKYLEWDHGHVTVTFHAPTEEKENSDDNNNDSVWSFEHEREMYYIRYANSDNVHLIIDSGHELPAYWFIWLDTLNHRYPNDTEWSRHTFAYSIFSQSQSPTSLTESTLPPTPPLTLHDQMTIDKTNPHATPLPASPPLLFRSQYIPHGGLMGLILLPHSFRLYQSWRNPSSEGYHNTFDLLTVFSTSSNVHQRQSAVNCGDNERAEIHFMRFLRDTNAFILHATSSKLIPANIQVSSNPKSSSTSSVMPIDAYSSALSSIALHHLPLYDTALRAVSHINTLIYRQELLPRLYQAKCHIAMPAFSIATQMESTNN